MLYFQRLSADVRRDFMANRKKNITVSSSKKGAANRIQKGQVLPRKEKLPEGVAKQRTMDLITHVDKVCEEFGIPEPAQFLAHLMCGNDPRKHSRVFSFMEQILDDRGNKPPTQDQWDFLCELITRHNRFEFVGLDLSSRAADRLIEFMYPKKRSVEVDAHIHANINAAVVSLTPKEIKDFDRLFNDEY